MAKAPDRSGLNWRLLLGFWLAASLVLVVRIVGDLGTRPLLLDTDDNMRMTTALDLLNGQNWFDHIEHRDNFPFGASLHWSHLIDAPIAGLMALLRPVFGPAAADIAAIVWPLLPLLALMGFSAALANRLAGRSGQLAGLVLPLITPVILSEFVPGRIDHHNVQMVLLLGLVAAAMAGRTRVLPAVLAGLAIAASLAIGMETLPYVVIGIVVFALFWILDPATSLRPVRGFALALGLGTLGFWLVSVGPDDYGIAACDFISITYVAAAGLAAIAMLAATGLGRGLARPWQRFALMAGLGLAAIAVTALLFPACLGGPYGQIAPIIVEKQFSLIADTQPLWAVLAVAPIPTLALIAAGLAGFAITVWRAVAERGARQADWLVVLGFSAATMLVTLLQMRGIRFTLLLGLPAGAWFIGYCRERYMARHSAWRAAGLVGSWLLFASVVHVLLPGLLPGPASAAATQTIGSIAGSARGQCFPEANFAALAALPPAALMTPFELGAAVLRNTPHSVVSAGFHRNAQGFADVIGFFQTDEATARAIAQRRGIAYVVFCPPLMEIQGMPYTQAGSFARAYGQNHLWSWLTPVSAAGDPIQIWRVDLGQPAVNLP